MSIPVILIDEYHFLHKDKDYETFFVLIADYWVKHGQTDNRLLSERKRNWKTMMIDRQTVVGVIHTISTTIHFCIC